MCCFGAVSSSVKRQPGTMGGSSAGGLLQTVVLRHRSITFTCIVEMHHVLAARRLLSPLLHSAVWTAHTQEDQQGRTWCM